jgi:putative copper resistance protein D
MGGSIDVAVAAARAIVFIFALQAAGAALVRIAVGPLPERVALHVDRVVVLASLLTILAVLARSVLEPARMAGGLSGVADPFLWSLFWQSNVALAQALRIVGAGLLLVVSLRSGRQARYVAWLGVALIVVSFAAMGHTRSHAGAALLGTLLTAHVGVAAYWFGALVPLLLVLRHAPTAEAARSLGAFSAVAVRAVPVLFVAGLVLAILLIGSVDGLATPYGRLVMLKLALFALLLGLAAANRYRWTTRFALEGNADRLQRAIVSESLVMLVLLGATAVMTTYYSPDT